MHAELPRWKEAVSVRFDQIAPTWRQRGLPTDERLGEVLTALACAPGDLVLDAGCGTGNWSAALALQGLRVRGFDLSPQMLAHAVEVARELGLDEEAVSFRPGDVERVDFPDALFDGIICFNVLDFAPRPGVALTELWRVLKPGGRLVLSDLGAYSAVKQQWWRRFLPDTTEVHTANDILPWEMEALLQELGWEIVEQRPLSGVTVDGVSNPHPEDLIAQLPTRVLQQAAALAWRFVALKPATA